MNLIQIIGLIIVFGATAFLILKHKKDIKETGKYSFTAVIIAWLFFLFLIISNSGIIKTQLPEELGGGARYTPQMEQKVEKQNAPKLKNANRDYKKEGKKALKDSLK